jgi:hypothetical protein
MFSWILLSDLRFREGFVLGKRLNPIRKPSKAFAYKIAWNVYQLRNNLESTGYVSVIEAQRSNNM